MPAVSVNNATTGTGNNQFEFVGTWTGPTADTPAYLGDEHYGNVTNDYYQVRFTGTQVKIYTTRGLAYGIVAVSINEGSETNVDCYNSFKEHQILVYTSPALSSGSHTLKVRITGTKNASATDFYTVGDRVDIQSLDPATLGAFDPELRPEAWF